MATKQILSYRDKYLFGLVRVEYTVTDQAPQLGKHTGINRYIYRIKLIVLWKTVMTWNIDATELQRGAINIGS